MPQVGVLCTPVFTPLVSPPGRVGRCAGLSGPEGGAEMVEPGGLRRLSRQRARNVPGGRPFRHVVKASEAEEARLVVLAARHQMTIPRLLVMSALERSDEITAADKRELLTELFVIHRLLGNMANNVNQLAKVANSTRELPPQTDAVLSAAWSTLHRIDGQIERFGLS